MYITQDSTGLHVTCAVRFLAFVYYIRHNRVFVLVSNINVKVKLFDSSSVAFWLTQFPLPHMRVYRMLVDIHNFTRTIFNYPKRANLYTCPIPVYPWIVQYMLHDVPNNPRGVYRQVFRLCILLMCTGK